MWSTQSDNLIPVNQKMILLSEHSNDEIDKRIFVLSTILFIKEVHISEFYFVHPFDDNYRHLISFSTFHTLYPNNFHYTHAVLVNPTAMAILSKITEKYRVAYQYDLYIDNYKVIHNTNKSFIVALNYYFP